MESHFEVAERENIREMSCILDFGDIDSSDEGSDKMVQMPKRRGRKRKRPSSCELADETVEEEKKRLLANSQERHRMEKLNKALDDLRKCLPQQFHLCNRRMSKIRTLRLAMNYIATLTDMINKDDLRREELCRRTLLAAQATPVTPGYFSSPDPRLTMPDTTGTSNPYHPYYSTLYDLASSNMYQTPVQTPPRHQGQPRHLDFFSRTQRTPAEAHKMIGEALDTANCGPSPAANVYYTPITNRDAKRLSSPFVGSRNFNEFDTSFLSNTSDICREEGSITIRPLEGIIPEEFPVTLCVSRPQGPSHMLESPECLPIHK